MTHKLLVHVEQYDKVGILPSQLESIALLSKAMGIAESAYVDLTPDGFRGVGGFKRYASFDSFVEDQKHSPMVVFSPLGGEDIRSAAIPDDAWLIFGPAMPFEHGIDQVVSIPGGELNSRDAVPIALWEIWKWREQ